MENQTDILVNFGNCIKAVEQKGDIVTVGSHGILWGSETQRDLANDYFVPETNLGARKGLGVDTMLHHGIPISDALKSYATELLPPTIKSEADDDGQFVATMLDLRNAYERKVYKAVEAKALFWSSGANPRGVLRADNEKAGKIIQWPLMEFSFTPAPMESRMAGISTVKALLSDGEYEPEAMANFVKAMTDTSFSLNVPHTITPKAPEPANAPAFKSALLGDYAEQDMTMSALRSGFDRLMYNCVYQCLEDNKMSVEEKAAKVGAGFDELKNLSMAVIKAVMGGMSGEDTTKALKYLDVTKPKPAVTGEARLDAKTFSEESEAALGAVKGCVERAAAIKALRAAKGKPLSRVGAAYLTELADEVETLLADVKAVLADSADTAPADAPVESAPVSDPLAALLHFQTLRAQLNGIEPVAVS